MDGATVQTRRQRRIAAVVTCALGLSLLGLGLRMPVTALGASTFDVMDGNDTVEAPERDWLSPAAAGFVTTRTDPSGAGDDSLNGNEDDVAPLFSLGSVQPNKGDLTGIRVAQERVGAQEFLYLAWNRVPYGTGNVAVDFELNKAAQPPLPTAVDEPWNLNRSSGDLLLTFELVSGGTNPIISMRRWLTGGTDACQHGTAKPCWGAASVLTATTSPAAEGSVDASPISFGEMAVDLGLAGIFTAGQCNSFASVYAKSRSSGSSFTSQVSDVVAPVQKSVTNCGALTVAKAVSGPTVAGDQTSFGFTVACTTAAGGTVDLDPATAGTSATFSLLDTESRAIHGVPSGSSCTVVETAPAPAAHWAPQYTVTDNAVGATSTSGTGTSATVSSLPLVGTTVAFTNVRRTGAVVVSKTSDVNGTFSFTLDCDGSAFDRTGTAAFSIATTAPGTAATTSITGLPIGIACAVAEVADARFTSTRTPANGTVTVAATAQTVSFSNTRKTAPLTVSKTSTGGTGTFRFAVDCDGTAHDRLGAAKLSLTTMAVGTAVTAQVTGVPTGTACTVTEEAHADYIGSLRAPSTTNAVTIDDDGETVFFENTRRTGTLTVAKTTTGGTGTFTFAVDCTDDRFDQQLTIVGSGSRTVPGIPTGVSCTVTETGDSLFTSTRTPTDGTVVMTEAGRTVSFLNVRNTGTLTISKRTTGGDGTFDFDVDCPGSAFDRNVGVVTTGGSGTADPVTGIPTGSTCTVTESVPAGWAAVGGAARTVVVDGVATAAFTNRRLLPAVAIDKRANVESVEPGGTVLYTFTVTNPGEVPLSAVAVTDDKCAPVTFVGGDTDLDRVLQTRETWVFECTQVQTGRVDTLTNIGTVTGIDPGGQRVTASDTVSITLVAPAVVTRDAVEVARVSPPVVTPFIAAAPVTAVPAATVPLATTGGDVRGLLQLGGALILLGLAMVVTAPWMIRRRATAD